MLKVLAPLVKARKGFHTDVARWAERQGFDTLYVDGKLVPVEQFRKLERFKEHTIDVVVGVIDAKRILKARNLVQRALDIGRGTAHLLDSRNQLTVMAPGVSGALITTVTALCVAIPAMFGYNFLVTSIRAAVVEMDNFAAELGSEFEHKYVDHNVREVAFRQ